MTGSIDTIVSTWNYGTIQQIKDLKSDTWLVTSIKGTYVLKRKHDISAVDRERAVLECLHRLSVPVQRIIAEYPSADGHVYCQYEYVEGAASIDGFGYTNARAMGEAIGLLHKAFASIELEYSFPVRDMYHSTFSSVLQLLSISNNPTIKRLVDVLVTLRDDMRLLERLPKQLIHRDAHGGNMIFHDGGFQGFIDFDLVEINARLFDPCYAAMGVLPQRYGETGFQQEWLHFLDGILTGYHQINPLTDEEFSAVWLTAFAIEVLFVAIFIKTSPKLAEQNADICMWLVQIREDVERLEQRLYSGGIDNRLVNQGG